MECPQARRGRVAGGEGPSCGVVQDAPDAGHDSKPLILWCMTSASWAEPVDAGCTPLFWRAEVVALRELTAAVVVGKLLTVSRAALVGRR